jgi:hypothetical protein
MKKIIGIFIFILMIISAISVVGQVKEVYSIDGIMVVNPFLNNKWMKTLGGNNPDMGLSAQQTSDGGYILLGATESYGAGENDIWLIKTDDQGNIIWDKTYGGEKQDYGWYLYQTSDGGYIITGRTSSFGNGESDVWLIKTDSEGNKLWDKTFGYSITDSGSEVKETNDGGYIIIGSVFQTGGPHGDIWLIKTDSNGNKLWDKEFGGIGHNYGNSILITDDGGFLLIGSSFISQEENSYQLWLIKTDENGEILWDKKLGGSNFEAGWCAQPTNDGGYIITGEIRSSEPESINTWLLKIDSNGDILWEKSFDGSDISRGHSVIPTNDDGYIIAGHTTVGPTYEAMLIKTNCNGDLEWKKTYGTFLGLEMFWSIQQTPDDGYIIAGETTSYGRGIGPNKGDVWLLKTDSKGNVPIKRIRSSIINYDKQNTVSNNEGQALIAQIYLELDPNSDQVQDILENYHSPPQGFLTNMDILVPNPNDEDGKSFMIAPLIRTLIGDWIDIGPFFEIIEPTETTVVHIRVLWGDVHYWPPGEENPEEFIIDGWSPLLSWEY